MGYSGSTLRNYYWEGLGEMPEREHGLTVYKALLLHSLSPSVHSKGADSDLKACYLNTNIALITMKHIFPDN